MHWARAYVGLPWDPAERHCWDFCRRVWAGHFGLDVPEMPVNADDLRATVQAFEGSGERTAWEPVPDPAEGDAVLMARGRRPCHVGIWISLGGVLHAIEPASVYTPRARLAELGYRIDRCYRRVGL